MKCGEATNHEPELSFLRQVTRNIVVSIYQQRWTKDTDENCEERKENGLKGSAPQAER